jgi:hypothetical protein
MFKVETTQQLGCWKKTDMDKWVGYSRIGMVPKFSIL